MQKNGLYNVIIRELAMSMIYQTSTVACVKLFNILNNYEKQLKWNQQVPVNIIATILLFLGRGGNHLIFFQGMVGGPYVYVLQGGRG